MSVFGKRLFLGKYGIVYYGLAGNPPKRMALKRIAKSMIQKNDVKTIMVLFLEFRYL